MYNRSQGRGRGHSSYRGRGGRSSDQALIQYGNKRLIAADISGLSQASRTELEEFNQWKKLQKKDDIPSSSKPSFSNIVQNNEQREDTMVQNQEEKIILLLNETDKKWAESPWTLYDRYISSYGYTMETYKSRLFYETILFTNDCEFNHFTHQNNKEVYNFSKIVIKRIISMEDWGISPFREKTLTYKGTPVRYNYWDYVQAFNKAFLYENDKRSHTWFIKFCPEVYNLPIPVWLVKWWQFYGTKEDILPIIIKDYFNQWQKVKPSIQEGNVIPDSMRFFIEFSIPYIWRTSPVTGYDQEFFCLKRRSYTRFWDKMLQEDEQKQLNCAITINLLEEKIKQYKQIKEEEEKTDLGGSEEDLTVDIHGATREEIIKTYFKGLKRALALKEEEDEKSVKSDTSMAYSKKSQNSFDGLQDAQDPDELESEISEEKWSTLLKEYLTDEPIKKEDK